MGLHWKAAAMVRMAAIGNPPIERAVHTNNLPILRMCLRFQGLLLGTNRAEFRILPSSPSLLLSNPPNGKVVQLHTIHLPILRTCPRLQVLILGTIRAGFRILSPSPSLLPSNPPGRMDIIFLHRCLRVCIGKWPLWFG